jgi:hypothetical protein
VLFSIPTLAFLGSLIGRHAQDIEVARRGL